MEGILNIARNTETPITARMALAMLEKHFPERIEDWKPATIAGKINKICLANGYEPESLEIESAVNEWMEE